MREPDLNSDFGLTQLIKLVSTANYLNESFYDVYSFPVGISCLAKFLLFSYNPKFYQSLNLQDFFIINKWIYWCNIFHTFDSCGGQICPGMLRLGKTHSGTARLSSRFIVQNA